MSAPIVALTAPTREMEGMMRVRLNEAYVNAARAAGMVPIVVPPLSPDELPVLLGAVDGVILTGGEDVDPAEFGAAKHPRTQTPHGDRDRCELALARLARERRVPTLAICRGIQVVNVAMGGTLIQDIPSEHPSDIDHDQSERRTQRVHDIEIESGSMLADAMGASRATVNSSHHQAIARVASGLRVTARAPDGIIEGAESTDPEWWLLGVQWHPEELIRDAQAWDRGLFKALADRLRVSPRASSAPRRTPGA
jgi:putative glutamine amidotransferase